MHKPRNDPALLALARVVEERHGAQAEFVASSLVYERAGNKMISGRSVFEFKLIGHPTAQACYAWSDPPRDGLGERFYAVLRTPEIDTPDKAVRASIGAK